MKLLDRDTHKDAIVAYLTNPDGDLSVLTEKQQQLLKYYFHAYTIRRNYLSMPDAINVLVKLSVHDGDPISASTARRYIVDAQDIFGNASKISKEAALHYGLSVIEDAIAMARDQGDAKTMIAGAKEYIEKATREEEAGIDPEKLQQHQVLISLDPRAEKVLEALAEKGSIDLDMLTGNVMNSMAEDARTEDD